MNLRFTNRLLFCAIVILLVACANVSGQTPTIGRSAIKTADGYLFIQNGNYQSFTLEFKGPDVKASTAGENPTFTIGGKLIQLVIVANRAFLNGVKDAPDEKKLELHRDWETDYLMKELYGTKFTVDSEAITQNDRKLLFWGFKRPGENKNYDRDYFLTTIVGEGLLGFDAPVGIGESTADYRKLMLDVMSTLKVSDKPFDVLKIADDLRKASGKP